MRSARHDAGRHRRPTGSRCPGTAHPPRVVRVLRRTRHAPSRRRHHRDQRPGRRPACPQIPAPLRSRYPPHLCQRRRRPPAPGPGGPGAPWRIGIAHPLRPGELAIVVMAHHDRAVATSGTAERGAHLLSPHHGAPVTAFAPPHRHRPPSDHDRHLCHRRIRQG
ncbi:FAD:protein FMN transferase [Streptomyces atratus]|uniref:FAD:protein FMN transferase n=1 Tax=Streptomyces atratus TaxID=1893 RepID=UPI0033FCAE53